MSSEDIRGNFLNDGTGVGHKNRRFSDSSDSDKEAEYLINNQTINEAALQIQMPVGSQNDLIVHELDDTIDLTIFEAAREGSLEKIITQVFFLSK